MQLGVKSRTVSIRCLTYERLRGFKTSLVFINGQPARRRLPTALTLSHSPAPAHPAAAALLGAVLTVAAILAGAAGGGAGAGGGAPDRTEGGGGSEEYQEQECGMGGFLHGDLL